MSEKVAVFDPESKDLRRLPRNTIDPTKFDTVNVPRLRRQFDVYESNKLANGHSHASHAIVTRLTDETEDKSFLARLYISRLGVTSELQRLLSSKHRILYIGSLADHPIHADSDLI